MEYLKSYPQNTHLQKMAERSATADIAEAVAMAKAYASFVIAHATEKKYV